MVSDYAKNDDINLMEKVEQEYGIYSSKINQLDHQKMFYWKVYVNFILFYLLSK